VLSNSIHCVVPVLLNIRTCRTIHFTSVSRHLSHTRPSILADLSWSRLSHSRCVHRAIGVPPLASHSHHSLRTAMRRGLSAVLRRSPFGALPLAKSLGFRCSSAAAAVASDSSSKGHSALEYWLAELESARCVLLLRVAGSVLA